MDRSFHGAISAQLHLKRISHSRVSHCASHNQYGQHIYTMYHHFSWLLKNVKWYCAKQLLLGRFQLYDWFETDLQLVKFSINNSIYLQMVDTLDNLPREVALIIIWLLYFLNLDYLLQWFSSTDYEFAKPTSLTDSIIYFVHLFPLRHHKLAFSLFTANDQPTFLTVVTF